MLITKRESLKRLGLGGAALVGEAAFDDGYVATSEKLPPGRSGIRRTSTSRGTFFRSGTRSRTARARRLRTAGCTCRALVPEGVENLLAAGRCLGAPDTCDTFRLICPCFVTGEAAGTAAALAAKRGCTPRELPYAELRRQLVANDVFV